MSDELERCQLAGFVWKICLGPITILPFLSFSSSLQASSSFARVHLLLQARTTSARIRCRRDGRAWNLRPMTKRMRVTQSRAVHFLDEGEISFLELSLAIRVRATSFLSIVETSNYNAYIENIWIVYAKFMQKLDHKLYVTNSLRNICVRHKNRRVRACLNSFDLFAYEIARTHCSCAM